MTDKTLVEQLPEELLAWLDSDYGKTLDDDLRLDLQRAADRIEELEAKLDRTNQTLIDACLDLDDADKRNAKLEKVREAAAAAAQFRFGVTFDAKGTYTKRKCVEWTELYLPLREALAACEDRDTADEKGQK